MANSDNIVSWQPNTLVQKFDNQIDVIMFEAH